MRARQIVTIFSPLRDIFNSRWQLGQIFSCNYAWLYFYYKQKTKCGGKRQKNITWKSTTRTSRAVNFVKDILYYSVTIILLYIERYVEIWLTLEYSILPYTLRVNKPHDFPTWPFLVHVLPISLVTSHECIVPISNSLFHSSIPGLM